MHAGSLVGTYAGLSATPGWFASLAWAAVMCAVVLRQGLTFEALQGGTGSSWWLCHPLHAGAAGPVLKYSPTNISGARPTAFPVACQLRVQLGQGALLQGALCVLRSLCVVVACCVSALCVTWGNVSVVQAGFAAVWSCCGASSMQAGLSWCPALGPFQTCGHAQLLSNIRMGV